MGWLDRLLGRETKEATVKMEPAVMKERGKEVVKMAKDPVCGMNVDEKKAAAKSEYMGKTYYFCAVGCKKTFDGNPAKYVKGEGQGMAGHGGHSMIGGG